MADHKSIDDAMIQIQRDMGPVLKNATNPAFRSKYADLGSVIETITGPLHDNGCYFHQAIDGMLLHTTIKHVASQSELKSSAPIISKDPDDPQKFGAAVTYMRRYSLLSLLGLAPEDDDGNSASQPRQHQNPNTVTGTRPDVAYNNTQQPPRDQSSKSFQSGAPQGQAPQQNGVLATPAQVNFILGLWRQELGDTNNSITTIELDMECQRIYGHGLEELTKQTASSWIKNLKGE